MPVEILALVAAVFFGSALVLTQIGLRYLPPLRGAAVSVPTTALFFLAISPVVLDLSAWHPHAAMIFALVGLLFPAVVTLTTFEANRRIGANMTGALGNLTPLFAVLLAFLVLGEVPRPWQIAGIAVIVGGVAVLFAGRRDAAAPAVGWAVLLALAASLIRGLVQPAIKIGLEEWPSPFAASLFGYCVSAIVILGAARFRRGGPAVAAQGKGWLWFCAVGICNGMAVLTMYAALARGPVALVAPLVACYPVVTLLLGSVVLGRNNLSVRVVAGIAVTVLGVALLLRS